MRGRLFAGIVTAASCFRSAWIDELHALAVELSGLAPDLVGVGLRFVRSHLEDAQIEEVDAGELAFPVGREQDENDTEV